ncbi:AraC family transcriptional regulator [Aureitalea marina]|uniref:HTH araC/xylS-type domain-containing protein n=1 Tax=Aureitalea marina TaxID=930804 RepID=A0A2S7KLG0_9FLAO|nr:AraC family transcriptional regulator [Aureitalea marina]PQB03474.1 hypothetical protein BST85_00120 [Aureitalea marina]
MKVLPFTIPKSGKAAIIVQEDQQEVFYERLHQHPEVQLSYIIKGQGTVFCKDSVHPYQAGDLILIPGGIPHVFNSQKQQEGLHHRISVFFESPWLTETIDRTPELTRLKSLYQHLERGYLWHGYSAKWKSSMNTLLKSRGINRFMAFMDLIPSLSRTDGEWLTSSDHTVPYDLTDSRRMTAVIDYTMNQFSQRIRLEELANEMAMTPSSFCKYFKKRTGKTYFGFLNEVRIEHACRKLIDQPEESVAQIAENSGFTNMANFNRRFKMGTGLTPREYKKQQKDQSSSN